MATYKLAEGMGHKERCQVSGVRRQGSAGREDVGGWRSAALEVGGKTKESVVRCQLSVAEIA